MHLAKSFSGKMKVTDLRLSDALMCSELSVLNLSLNTSPGPIPSLNSTKYVENRLNGMR